MATARPAPSTESIEIPQDGLGTILLMFAWPAAWFSLLIYGAGRPLIPEGGTTPTWLRMAILILGTGLELVVAIVLLRREARGRGLSWWRERLRWRWPRGWKAWAAAAIVLVLALGLSTAMGPVSRSLASVPGFVPPEWWGAASNPTASVNSAADVFPDIELAGNWGFVLLYFVIGLVFNIVGEELYYRGYLLPRMRGVFGRWDWLANGVLFTLVHVYQRWLWPAILVGGLAFGFAAGPLGSLPLAMVYHWAGNFLLPLVLMVMAVMGIGS